MHGPVSWPPPCWRWPPEPCTGSGCNRRNLAATCANCHGTSGNVRGKARSSRWPACREDLAQIADTRAAPSPRRSCTRSPGLHRRSAQAHRRTVRRQKPTLRRNDGMNDIHVLPPPPARCRRCARVVLRSRVARPLPPARDRPRGGGRRRLRQRHRGAALPEAVGRQCRRDAGRAQRRLRLLPDLQPRAGRLQTDGDSRAATTA